MGGLNFDISSLSPRLMATIVLTIGLLFAYALFPTFSGSAQGWYLSARDGGSCQYAGQRFDRIVGMDDALGSDPNEYNWGATPLAVGDLNTTAAISGKPVTVVQDATDAKKCALDVTATGVKIHSGLKFLTAQGTPISINTVADKNEIANSGTTKSFRWKDRAGMFSDNPAIINIVIGATILIIGIGPIVVMGMIGVQLLNKFAGGLTGPAKYLLATLGASIIFVLVGSFTDFISIAYDAVSIDRFTMYETTLAGLALMLKQWWGVIFAAGFVGVGGYFAWGGVQKMRSGRRGARGMSDSQMA